MRDPRLYAGPVKLVLAFDIGTIYSGVSYCILEPRRVPEVLTVVRFPAQGADNAKVPSLLYYDKGGNVRAAGAEVFSDNVIKTARNQGWTKAEWWKLHLRPKDVTDLDDYLPPLPPGKSAVDLLTDFIKYLFSCCKSYIQDCHRALAWSSIEHSIEYILTYPGGWEAQKCLYCEAIERACLVPSIPVQQPRVHVLTEAEASLHFCVSRLKEKISDQAARQGIVIIDAGGGVLDLSMYSMTSNPISYEEIAPAESRLQGSIFVTRRATALMQRKLEGWEHTGVDDITQITREFNQTTKFLIESDQEPVYIRVASRRTNSSRRNVSSGHMKLSGEEAAGLFDESINAITDAFQSQEKFADLPITTAFLIGGLSTNDLVWSRLQSYFAAKNVNICRLDSNADRAVAYGAVLCHVNRDDRVIVPRAARSGYNAMDQDLQPTEEEKAGPEKVIEQLKSRVADLEKTVAELDAKLVNTANEKDNLDRTNQSLHALLRAHKQKHKCEALYAQGRVMDAATCLMEIMNTTSEAVRADEIIVQWIAEFTHRCVSALVVKGDEVSRARKDDEAILAYSTALSLSHLTPTPVLAKWARIMLNRGSSSEALCAAAKFKLPRFVICLAISDILEKDGRVMEAIMHYRQTACELAGDTRFYRERAQWEEAFQRRCVKRLEQLCNGEMKSKDYGQAAEHLSAMLSLNPPDCIDILVKRSRAHALMNSWEEALNDANEAIKLDPSCYQGYEARHAALHGARRYAEAVEAFDTMLSKLGESPEVEIRQIRDRYCDARITIRNIVKDTICFIPRVLIDTASGRLYAKKEQAEAFEALPIYNELVSSMTTQLDPDQIREVVTKFYRYVMLSHKWGDGEPLLENIGETSVYVLGASPMNDKLQNFCRIVQSLGFQWAWSDNACVDKSSNVILQEALVAMFGWYRGSSLTIVYLCDVPSKSQQPGDLQRSIWNTRAWTYQEYVAAMIIRFYTKDWQPYLGLPVFNHKESLAIIAEMQHATQVSAQEIAVLRPGLDRVREKLYLASRRQTTLPEDIAYSLFGIFNVGLPIIYGEGDRAVGRLLEHILTGSGDATLLAWTGNTGSYNSCLPKDLAVYSSLVPPHVPRPIRAAEMDGIVMRLRLSLDISLATTLLRRLNNLPSPSLVANRLRLPGIVFTLTGLALSPRRNPAIAGSLRTYLAASSAFGVVEIKTTEDLTESLCLIHPWIRPMLDQEYTHGAAALDEATQALRFVSRLRQPFGALLFVPLSSAKYRRVAADSLVKVQIRDDVSLTQLIEGVRTIEVQ